MGTTEPIPVIIDTDPGLDDAVAILAALGSPELRVLGLTTVAGNLGLSVTTVNARRLLALAGRPEIPVARSAARPLRRAPIEVADVHGADGLGGVALPEPEATESSSSALDLTAETLLAHPPGTLRILALGPLTNVATLLAERPEAARRLGGIIAMGGALDEPGNVGERAEFNLAADPDAAAAVFAADIPVTLVPLDVTRRVRATRDWVADLAASGNPVAAAAAALIGAYFASTAGRDSRPLHDPCVVLHALRPELFAGEPIAIRVIRDGPDAGAIERSDGDSYVTVLRGVDAPAALTLLAARLTGEARDA
jgi:inosine-uridine nucleoside N-ribohydrolase